MTPVDEFLTWWSESNAFGGTYRRVTIRTSGSNGGAPEVLIAAPKGPFYGLFIGFKREGKISNAQRRTAKDLEKQGFAVEIVADFEHAKQAANTYMSQPATVRLP